MRSLALPACCASGSKPGRRARFLLPPTRRTRRRCCRRVWRRNARDLPTARRSPDNDGLDWLALLSTPRLRLATSTPGCDPSGDYTWQLFARIEARYPGLGNAMAGRAQQLVGGRDSLSVPPGEIAGAWLIRQNLADLFIGYAHYGPALATCDDLRTLTIPAPWNIRCDYQLARLRADPAALALYRFILGDVGQGYLRQAGFMPFSDAA